MNKQKLIPFFCALLVAFGTVTTVTAQQAEMPKKPGGAEVERKPPCTMPVKVSNPNASPNAAQNGMTPAQARYGAETTDADCDGISNWDDNCPSDHNPKQTDRNKNGFGDVCEPKRVSTISVGLQDTRKRPCTMPFKPRKTNPSRTGGDSGMTPEQALYLAETADEDCDGISNAYDNCISTFNPKQTDRNRNGRGDVCEPGRRVRKPSRTRR